MDELWSRIVQRLGAPKPVHAVTLRDRLELVKVVVAEVAAAQRLDDAETERLFGLVDAVYGVHRVVSSPEEGRRRWLAGQQPPAERDPLRLVTLLRPLCGRRQEEDAGMAHLILQKGRIQELLHRWEVRRITEGTTPQTEPDLQGERLAELLGTGKDVALAAQALPPPGSVDRDRLLNMVLSLLLSRAAAAFADLEALSDKDVQNKLMSFAPQQHGL